jgi:hypothetical protein
LREAAGSRRDAVDPPANGVCDVCGSTEIMAFKCKLMCQNCGTILRTCSDLAAATHPSR